MGMLLIVLVLKNRVNDSDPVILRIHYLQLGLLGSLLNHLFVSLDLNLEYPIFLLDSIQLLVVFLIIGLDFLHTALHDVAFTFDLRLYDLRINQVNALIFWVESLVASACCTFSKRLSDTRGGLGDV